MPEFSCRIATLSGEVTQRTCTADDEASLRRELESQDLLLLDAHERSVFVAEVARTLRLARKVPAKEFLFFNQELRALIKAGLPIVPSLNILLERRKNKLFRSALIDIRDRIKSGESLSEAFASQGDMFPKLYATSLASGERSGELASVIERYIAYQRNVLAVRRKVISALIYPIALMTMSLGLVLVMVFFIIPKFQTFLTEFGTDLPWITQTILDLSVFCRAHWFSLIGGSSSAIVALLWWNSTPAGRLFVDRITLRLPVFGGVINNYAQNRFTRTLATLQAGGIPLVTSLDLSARAVGNAVFETGLLTVADRVREGRALWESIDEVHLLSDIAVQMIKVGESTGGLDEMLNAASDFTDEEIESQLTRIMALFEPVMLLAIAAVVAVMLLSIYYPLIQLYGQTSM